MWAETYWVECCELVIDKAQNEQHKVILLVSKFLAWYILGLFLGCEAAPMGKLTAAPSVSLQFIIIYPPFNFLRQRIRLPITKYMWQGLRVLAGRCNMDVQGKQM
jgi:hypothetical protein